MQHLEEGTIHAWLDGALPTAEAREVELHVAECSECSAMLAEARGLIAGASRIVSSLDVVRGNVIPKAAAKGGAGKSMWHALRLNPARAALAATVLIAVSSLLAVRHDTAEKMVIASPAALSAPVAAAPSAANALAPAPAPTAGRVVADATPAEETPALREKDRVELANKPKAEVKTEVAMDAITRRADSVRVDAAAKPSVVAAAPPIVQSAPAAAAAGASANLMDTSLKKVLTRVVQTDSIGLRAQARTRAVAPTFAEQRSSFTVNPACFQFADPPAAGVPQRFALEFLQGDTSQRIVRAVNETGRLDSTLAGSTWTRATPTEITVRFASNDRPVTLPIRDATLVSSAVDERRESVKRTGPSVSRLPCRP